MPVLTMTKISGDIDTVALMGYAEAENRSEFIRDYCRENYGNAHMVLHKAVAGAIKQAAEVFNIDTTPRSYNRGRDYRSIQMADH